MSIQSVKVPAIGESITEVVIGTWKKSEGEAVGTDEPLVEVESDKASMDVPAPAAGVLKRILRAQGETAAVGEIIAEIEPGAVAAGPGKAAAPAPAPAKAKAPEPVAAAVKTPAVVNGQDDGADGHAGETFKASPAVRKMMAERGLSARDVQPSGPAGRIERHDLDRPTPPTGAPSPAPTLDLGNGPSRRQGVGGPRDRVAQERAVRMTPLRKTVARRLLEAQRNAAILTTFNEVDMGQVMSLRDRYRDAFLNRHGIKLGFMSFFVKAVVEGLKAFPVVNAEVRGDDIIHKDYYDIGVAVGGGRGLVVPVVRDCDRLSLAEIEKSIGELAGRARENRLSLEELQGGTFTISNGGIYGSMLSTPILNPPQSAILGLHKIQERPMVVGGQIVARPMMYLALSYDHRIVDGREAVQFLVRIKECIEDPERLLIEV